MDSVVNINDGSPVQDSSGTGDRTSELKEAVAGIGATLNENLQAISTHVTNAENAQREILKRLDGLFGGWAQNLEAQHQIAQQNLEGIQRRYDGVQQQIKGVQHHHDKVLQEFSALRDEFQAAREQCLEARRECESFAQQFGAAEQKVKGLEQCLEAALAECSTISASMKEESRRRQNVEVSIGGLVQDIGALRATEIARLKDDIESLREANTAGRRRQKFAVAVAFLALLAASYVGLGKPGWTAVAGLVAPLLPPGSI